MKAFSRSLELHSSGVWDVMSRLRNVFTNTLQTSTRQHDGFGHFSAVVVAHVRFVSLLFFVYFLPLALTSRFGWLICGEVSIAWINTATQDGLDRWRRERSSSQIWPLSSSSCLGWNLNFILFSLSWSISLVSCQVHQVFDLSCWPLAHTDIGRFENWKSQQQHEHMTKTRWNANDCPYLTTFRASSWPFLPSISSHLSQTQMQFSLRAAPQGPVDRHSMGVGLTEKFKSPEKLQIHPFNSSYLHAQRCSPDRVNT